MKNHPPSNDMVISKKLIHLRSWLKENKLVGCLIQDPTNLLYYTGLKLSTGILFVGLKKEVLVVDFRYYARCKQMLPITVESTKNFEQTLERLKLPRKCVIDSQVTYLKEYELYKKVVDPVSIPGFLSKLRAQKTMGEVEKIKKSCHLTQKGFRYIQKQFKEGVSEKELAYKLEMYLRKNGAEEMAFDPIIAFGKNAANPHYTPSPLMKLKKNDLILIDCGIGIDHYYSDMTRTYAFGKIPKRMQHLITICDEAQKKAVSICKAGLSLKKLNEAVTDIFKREGVEDLFIHALGHGVGLQVHEYPSLSLKDEILKKGMVITIEPGLYVEGLGGVRIEDTLLITQSGYENLTA